MLFFPLNHHGIEVPQKYCFDVYRAMPQLSVSLQLALHKHFMQIQQSDTWHQMYNLTFFIFLNLLQRSLR